jgi:hypothetical protein
MTLNTAYIGANQCASRRKCVYENREAGKALGEDKEYPVRTAVPLHR